MMNRSLQNFPGVATRVAIVAVTMLASVGVGCKQQGPADTKVDAGPKVRVTTTAVVSQPMPRVLPLTGSLRGEEQSDLAAGTAGRLLRVQIERGSEVKKGDVLAVVDTRQAQLTAAEAKTSAALAAAQGANAQRDCERYKALFDKGSISRAEYDKFTDQCKTTDLSAKAAELRAAQAGQTVSDGIIRAPFSGVIADRWVDVGEFVRTDTKVVTLVTMNPLRLEFAVPEARMNLVKKGAEVTFHVPSHPGKAWKGTVKFLSAAVREASRDVVVEAAVDNADRQLAPGMFAEVELSLGEEKTTVVPTGAIIARESLSHLFVVEDGRAVERVVAVGPTKEGLVAITRGVKDGEKVILSPPPELSNGTYVDF
ncbi:MAG: efflux RND transporter periplasmic adaptor subunit [Polyangiaceae bacterium]